MVISRGKKDKTKRLHELREAVVADLHFVVPIDDVNFAHQVFIKYLQKAYEEQESHDLNSNFHSSTDALSGQSRHKSSLQNESGHSDRGSEYPYRRDGRSKDYRHDRYDRRDGWDTYKPSYRAKPSHRPETSSRHRQNRQKGTKRQKRTPLGLVLTFETE
eukprot:GHVP01008777.1.p1 GENE.GHVP01008777.1~~GHVP01008777.1.p1  ORF type:complete len:160 (-),score=19.88 GHVP01008777.1:73-552(-)